MDKKILKIKLPAGYSINPFYTAGPTSEEKLAMKWDGGGVHCVYSVICACLVLSVTTSWCHLCSGCCGRLITGMWG